MTNDKTVTMSRELAEEIFDELPDWNTPAGTTLGALLAAPVVERQDPAAYLRQSDIVRLNQPHVAGCAASLSKEPAAGFLAIYTAPVAVVLDERAEFEAWYLGKFCGGQARLFRCVNADQIYYFAEVQSKWDAWQARACLDKVKELNQ